MHRFTIILQHPTKQLNPSYASLFNLLPSGILADIDIWLPGLEHCDKFKHVILRLKYMCKPVLFANLPRHMKSVSYFKRLPLIQKIEKMIGHTDILWLGTIVTGNTMNINKKNKCITQLSPDILWHSEFC